MKQSEIQAYVNNFRRQLTPWLRPGLGMKCLIYPVDSGGAVLVFELAENLENDDQYRPGAVSLGSAFAGVKSRAFSGNLDRITFHGTNVFLEPGRVILVKDGSPSEWSELAAQKDVKRIVMPSGGGAA